MSQTYTPVATSHGSFTLPSDGDPAVAESVNDAFRDLADNALVALNTSASALATALQMINGVTGGSYAPAAKIILTASGIQLSGTGADLVLTGQSTIQVSGTLFVSTTSVSVPGNAVFSGSSVEFSTGTTVSIDIASIDELTVDSFQVEGNSSIGDSSVDLLTVEATSTFNGPVTFNDTKLFRQGSTEFREPVLFSRAVTLGDGEADTITIGGTVDLQTRLGYSGVGRVPYRPIVTLPTGGATVSVEDGDVFLVPTSATGNYSVSSASAGDGDRMRFFCQGAMSSSRSIIAGAATHTFTAGNTTYSELIFDSGAWTLALFTSF